MSKSYSLALLFSLSLLVLDALGWLGWLKGPAQSWLVLPIRQYVYQAKLNWDKRLAFIKDGQKLNEQLRELREEKALLEAQNLRLKVLEGENEEMRALLETASATKSEFILAHALAFHSGELLLDAGLKSGVEIGKEVVASDNLLGYIFQVEERLSRVRLLTHGQSRVSAAVINEKGEKAAGILKGQFGTKMRLHEILQSDDFSLGDRVVAIGIQGGLNNLPVGEVVKIDKKEADVYQEAEVEGFVEVGKLEVVFVVK